MSAGQFIQPGSAYYFKGWNTNTDSPQGKFPQQNQQKLSPKDSWKTWSNLPQHLDDERSSSRGSGSLPDDVMMACKVGETREMQREKANKVATACAGGRKNKAALMFQKRFERSERFALVKEAQERPKTPEITIPEKSEEVGVDEETLPPPPPDLDDPLLMETEVFDPEALNVIKMYHPKPWESIFGRAPSPPPIREVNDFNKKTRGFTGSYVSPYGAYAPDDIVYETCDL